MFCSTKGRLAALLIASLAASGCGDHIERIAQAVPTPVERLICDATTTRPHLPVEYQIDWTAVAQAPSVPVAVDRAKAEVGKLVGTIRDREQIVAGYIIDVEGKLFVCSNNMQWRRDFEAGLAKASK